MSKFIGIDISKQTFDYAFLKTEGWQHESLANNSKGFIELTKYLDKSDTIVMEASGPYYLPLANYFYSHGYSVSVVNPLIIKRFSQAKLSRAKTDKQDARIISEYGSMYRPKFWKPDTSEITQLKQLQTSIELIGKQIRQNKNQLEAFSSTGMLDQSLSKTIAEIIKALEEKKAILEKRVIEISETYFGDALELLKSIPGIGPKTATMLIIITDNFTKFDNYKQLIAYVGFSPRIYQSGTSVKGKGHICKMGKGQIRKLLYLCSWSAKRRNLCCINMYNRLKERGKPERVIKIAITNKLLKQVFAIAKSKKPYIENYAF